MPTSRLRRALLIAALALLPAPAAFAAPMSKAKQVLMYRVSAQARVQVTPAAFAAAGTLPQTVALRNDYLYGHDIRVKAYPLDAFLRASIPDLQRFLDADAKVMLYCADGYAPIAKLRDLMNSGGYIAVADAALGNTWPTATYKDKPLEAAAIGNYLVWENFRYPQKPQPWGLVTLYVLPADAAVK